MDGLFSLGPSLSFSWVPLLEHLLPIQLNSMQILPLAGSNSKYPHFYILTAAFFLLSSLTFPRYHIFFQIRPSLSPTSLFTPLLAGGCPWLACDDLCCSTTLTKGNLLSRAHMFYAHGSTGEGIASLTSEPCCARSLSPVSSVSPEHSACSFCHRQLPDLQREERPQRHVNVLSLSSVPRKEGVDTTLCPSRKLPPSQPVMPSETSEKTPVIHTGHGAGILHRSMQAFKNHCSVISTK